MTTTSTKSFRKPVKPVADSKPATTKGGSVLEINTANLTALNVTPHGQAQPQVALIEGGRYLVVVIDMAVTGWLSKGGVDANGQPKPPAYELNCSSGGWRNIPEVPEDYRINIAGGYLIPKNKRK